MNKATVEQQKRIESLENSEGSGGTDPRLPYRLGTDKAARAGAPAIELVDAEDNYSNVKLVGLNGIKTESTVSGINIDGSGLLTSEDANKTFLRDGFISFKTNIFRRGGTNDDAIKLTMDEGGGTLWRLNNKEGKGKSVVYETSNNCSHQFNTDKDGTIKKVFHIQNNYVDSFTFSRFLNGIAVKAEGQSIGGNNVFDVRPTYGTYNGRTELETDLVNKSYVDTVAQYPTTKYDKDYTFIDGNGASTVAPGQVLFTDINDLRMTLPAKITNICLCKSDFNWNAFIYNGIVKTINDVGKVSGYFLVVDYLENAGRNMTLNVKYLDRGGSGGSLNPTLDCTLSFRNCFYN